MRTLYEMRSQAAASGTGWIACSIEELNAVNEELKQLQAIRCAWQWPEWLNAAAIVKTRWTVWLACERIPTTSECFPNGWEKVGATMALGDLVKFKPPPCDDWRDSLRVNPNREGN